MQRKRDFDANKKFLEDVVETMNLKRDPIRSAKTKFRKAIDLIDPPKKDEDAFSSDSS